MNRAAIEHLFGFLWPLWISLAVMLSLVALLFSYAAWGGAGVQPGVAQFFAVSFGVLMLLTGTSAVHKQVLMRRIWRSRIGPQAARRRVSAATAAGLAVMLLCGMPVLLLASLARDGALPPLALLSACLMALAALASLTAALQGSLPLPAGLPGAAGLGAVMALGWQRVWLGWAEQGAATQGAGLAVALALLAWTFLAPEPAVARPAFTPWLRETLQRAAQRWRQRFVVLREHGESGSISFVWWYVFFPMPTFLEVPATLGSQAWGAFALGIVLLFAYKSVICPPLHWRWQLAPGGLLRRHLGLQTALASLNHFLLWVLLVSSVGLVIGLLLFGADVFTAGDDAKAGALPPWAMLSVAVARMGLAVLLAVWLRTLDAPAWRLMLLGFGAVLLQLLATWALGSALGPDWPSLASWIVTLVGALLLARPIQQGWARCDFSRFAIPGEQQPDAG